MSPTEVPWPSQVLVSAIVVVLVLEAEVMVVLFRLKEHPINTLVQGGPVVVESASHPDGREGRHPVHCPSAARGSLPRVGLPSASSYSPRTLPTRGI